MLENMGNNAGRVRTASGRNLRVFQLTKEEFSNATTTATTDIKILSLPIGSTDGEPSSYEYWRNGVSADNQWTFLKGSTPSVGTGPTTLLGLGKFAYCEVLPSKVGQTFSLVTPLIDMLDVSSDSSFRMLFKYHMHGAHIGNLKVQASQDPNFESGVEDLLAHYDFGGESIYTCLLYTSDAADE